MAQNADKRKPRIEMHCVEVRSTFRDVLDRVGFGGERVIVKRNKKATAAIIGMADLEKLEKCESAA